jgi:lipoate-protein ligase A
MESWRLLDFEYPDALSNLALEEALARQIGEGKSPRTLRLWRNHRAAVIGENQSAKLELQLDACKALGVEVIRRFTGGGAVYHDLGNLNYSICTPKPSPPSLQFQQEAFEKALECVVTCLDTLGLDSTKVPVNAIMVNGHKISGGAGAVRWGAIFYHGSILVSTDLQVVWKILKREQPRVGPPFVQSKRVPLTSLERELDRPISLDQVKRAFSMAFERIFDARLIPSPATEQELHVASSLVKEKYGTDQWNLKM